MTKFVFYEDEHVVAYHRDGASNYTMTTFSNFGFEANHGRFWGEAFCDREALHATGFVARRNNWFPACSMRHAIEAALRLQCPPRITYGHSQGGYAALKYSAALSAIGGLACAPQYSINPEKSPDDQRFSSNYLPDLHDNMELVCEDFSGNLTIVHDPHERADQYQVDLIMAACPGRTILMAPADHLGHDVMEVMTDREVLAGLLEQCRSGSVPPRLHALMKAARRRSHRYAMRLSGRLVSGMKPLTAVRVLETVEATARAPLNSADKEVFLMLAARAYMGAKRPQDAVRRLDELATIAGGNPHYHAYLGSCLLASRQPTRAMHAYQRAVDLRPGNMVFLEGMTESRRRMERQVQP